MLSRLSARYGKTKVRISIGVLVVLLVVVGSTLLGGGDEPSSETAAATQIVRVAPAGELAAFGRGISVVGTVTAVDEAEVKSEIGGQITTVNVAIGDRVGAGSILATFENASERAAVLQAEGAYEAAVASAQQSDISAGASAEDVTSAEIDAWNEFRDAFIDADDVMRNTLDDIFSDTTSATLELDDFSWEKRLIRYELERWGDRSLSARPSGETLDTELATAETLTRRLVTLIDAVYDQVTRKERQIDAATTLATIATYKTDLATARTTLNTASSALSSTVAALQSTRADYRRAQIAGTGGTVSAADAAVKQALGSLRAAQASLEKTIVRSPIAGAVNTVHVKRGAYVGAASPIAMVVSEGALEVSTYLTEADRNRLAVGDAVSFSEGGTGTVTRIAPSIDRTTQKYEVQISPETDELEAGDVVRVLLSEETEAGASVSDTPLFIPLSAIKLTADSAVVFSVENGTLTEHEVTLGDVRGTSVHVTEGLARELVIVTDARGLAAGDPIRVAE